jgi:hypothetical protein
MNDKTRRVFESKISDPMDFYIEHVAEYLVPKLMGNDPRN